MCFCKSLILLLPFTMRNQFSLAGSRDGRLGNPRIFLAVVTPVRDGCRKMVPDYRRRRRCVPNLSRDFADPSHLSVFQITVSKWSNGGFDGRFQEHEFVATS